MKRSENLIIPSVHHSGTNFIVQELTSGRAEGLNYKGKILSPEPGFYVRIHCEPDFEEHLHNWCSKYPALIPLRHPRRIFASWKARDKDLNELVEQFRILKSLQKYDPWYLPIDHPERENILTELAAALPIRSNTKWPVIMSCGKTAELDDEEHAMVDDVMADGFFDTFYFLEDLP